MSEPTASSTAVTVSSPTLTFRSRNSRRTKSARSRGLRDPRARVHLGAELLRAESASALARPPPECTTTSMVPGGRSAAASAMSATASLPASAAGLQHHHPLVGEQRRAQQLGELAGADLARAHAIDGHVVRCPPASRADRSTVADGALDEQFFVTQDEVQLAHAQIVSRRADSAIPADTAPATAHASRQTTAAATPMRPHRHRHSTTAPIPATATPAHAAAARTAPARRRRARADAHRATRSSHHSSGPVKRISNCAAGRPERRHRRRGGADHRDRRDDHRHREVRQRPPPG